MIFLVLNSADHSKFSRLSISIHEEVTSACSRSAEHPAYIERSEKCLYLKVRKMYEVN